MDALRMWSHLLEPDQPVAPEARALYRRAMDLGESGDWSAAVSMFEGCLAQLEGENAPEAAAANHSLAVILQQQSDRDGAVFHCVRAIYLYENAGDLGGIYAGLRNLSVIHWSRQESQLALEAQAQSARVRQLLASQGDLERVEAGRDRYGEPLVLLRVRDARAPMALVRDVG